MQTVAAPSSDGFPHTPSKSVVLAHATQILHIRPCVAFSHVVSLFRYTKESSSSAKSRKRLSLPLSGRIALKRTTSAAGDEASEEARYTIRSAYLLLEFTSVCFSSIKFFLTKKISRRLTHYTSMATVAGPGGPEQASPVEGQESPVHQTLAPGGRPPGHLTVSDTSRTSNARGSGQPALPNTKASGHLTVSNTRTSGPLSVSNTRTQNPERRQSKIQGGGKTAPDKKYR